MLFGKSQKIGISLVAETMKIIICNPDPGEKSFREKNTTVHFSGQ
jgi:hypothetical protein